MIELFNDILNAILKLVFFMYMIVLVVMAVTGLIGLTSLMYFISEVVMLVVGYIIYKVRRDCYGPNDFSIIRAACTLVGFWPLAIWGSTGLILTVIARFIYYMKITV